MQQTTLFQFRGLVAGVDEEVLEYSGIYEDRDGRYALVSEETREEAWQCWSAYPIELRDEPEED